MTSAAYSILRRLAIVSPQAREAVRSTATVSALSSSALPYAEAKAAAKQKRTEQWKQKQERLKRLETRRDGKPKDVKKTEFRSWFDKRRTYQEIMDRKARQAGMEWTIRAAAVVERLPVVMPDKPQWERDYIDLKTYLMSFGKIYPEELGRTVSGELPMTEEEIIEMLPDGFTPASRITEADKSGDVKTRDRRLATRVYLAVVPSHADRDRWGFLTVALEPEETLLQAAQRAVRESVGERMELYCPSNCPVAVDLYVHSDEEKKSTGTFGTKTFFMRLQHDEGDILTDKHLVSSPVMDFAWLDRPEMKQRIKEQQGEDASKFYHYLL